MFCFLLQEQNILPQKDQKIQKINKSQKPIPKMSKGSEETVLRGGRASGQAPPGMPSSLSHRGDPAQGRRSRGQRPLGGHGGRTTRRLPNASRARGPGPLGLTCPLARGRDRPPGRHLEGSGTQVVDRPEAPGAPVGFHSLRRLRPQRGAWRGSRAAPAEPAGAPELGFILEESGSGRRRRDAVRGFYSLSFIGMKLSSR